MEHLHYHYQQIKRFTPTKKVFLYFYSITPENKYKYLYIKNFLSPEKLGVVYTEVLLKDNSPLFSLGRILTNSFYKLFIDDNISKILKGEITDLSS